MRSKTDSPPAVMYWSRMAEIRATVFPDFEGPCAARGGRSGRVAVLRCTRRSGRASLVPFLLQALRNLLAQPGRQGVSGLAGPVPACLWARFWAVSGCRPSGADRLAGNPRQVVPYSGGVLVAKAVHAVGHIVVRQRLHVGPTFEQARSRVLDGPPLRPETADDLDGFQNQAIALGQPSGSSGQGSGEFRADGRGPD